MLTATEKERTNDSKWHLKMIIDLRDIPILYMNMDEDKRRYRDMNLLFNDLVQDFGFKKENIYRIPGTTRNAVKANGVSEAHLAAMEFSKQFNGPFLVLEDDLEVAAFDPIINVPDNADAVYLGTMMHGIEFNGAWPVYPVIPSNGITVNVVPDVYPENPEIYRVLSMTGGQSILYVTDVFRTIVENSCKWGIEQSMCHDTYLATVQRLAYVYSYNQPMFINKTCRWDSSFMLEQAFYDKGKRYDRVYEKPKEEK